MSKGLEKRMITVSHQIDINKEIEIIKRNQIKSWELKRTIIEMADSLEGLKSVFEQAEESVSLKMDQQRLSGLRNRK